MADARPAAKHGDIAGLSFEAALKELEGIVGRLERGEALKQHCDRLLRQAEAKVERITFGADGKPAGTQPFEPQQ